MMINEKANSNGRIITAPCESRLLLALNRQLNGLPFRSPAHATHEPSKPANPRGHGQRRMMTLIEVMIALIILTITAIGSGAFFYQAFSLMETARNKRLALDLATAQLDSLQSATTNFDTITDKTESNILIGQWPGTITTDVTDRADGTAKYKELFVTVSWVGNQKTQVVTLESIVGEK